MEWISLLDKLPKSGSTVLIFCPKQPNEYYDTDDEILVAVFSKSKCFWCNRRIPSFSGLMDDCCGFHKHMEKDIEIGSTFDGFVTHWMPLPKKPQGVK